MFSVITFLYIIFQCVYSTGMFANFANVRSFVTVFKAHSILCEITFFNPFLISAVTVFRCKLINGWSVTHKPLQHYYFLAEVGEISGVDPVLKVGGRGTNLYRHICMHYIYIYTHYIYALYICIIYICIIYIYIHIYI